MKTNLEKLIEKTNQEVLSQMDIQQELRMKMAESKAKIIKLRKKEKELHSLWLHNN